MKWTSTACCIGIVACSGAASAQEFIPFAPLPGDIRVSLDGVSGDGSVIVGTSYGPGGAFDRRSFIWTEADGYTVLDPIGTWTLAFAISADGSTVVGMTNLEAGNNCAIPVRWVNGGPPEHLNPDPDTSGFGCAAAVGVSADGNVITGEGDYWDGSNWHLRAFRWTPATGMHTLGSFTPDDFEVIGTAVSEDGSTIVGGAEPDFYEAFRWTEMEGLVGLGWLPGASGWSIATAVSADGSVIGGQSSRPPGHGGFASAYWTEDSGWIEIPPVIPSATTLNAVWSMTGDGSVMIGLNTGTNPFHRQPFIWDETNGARQLQDALENEYNIDLMGWKLGDHPAPYNNIGYASAISSDGSTIVGATLHPDELVQWGYIVRLTPTTCPGDLTGDGNVGVPDLLALLACWGPVEPGSGCEDADLTGSGAVGVPDLLELLSNWGPCPE